MRDISTNALPAGWILKQQYQIESVLGCGGFGITYGAIDRRRNMRVAIKEFFPNQSVMRTTATQQVSVIFGQEDYFEHLKSRFWQEGKLIHQLNDIPDILQVYHVFEENGTVYIAMEYLDGCDLEKYIKGNGCLSIKQAEQFLKSLLVSLEGIHQKGLIHRDISPDNIYITRDGSVKLIDFGSLRSYSMNQNMTTILKHTFSPYEQYQSKGKQGPWTDIYSLAVSFYYALSGNLIPSAPDRLLNQEVPDIRTLRPDVSERMAGVLSKAMEMRKEDRYQSAKDMYVSLFPDGDEFWIQGLFGVYKDKQWKVHSRTTITFGREKENQVTFPSDTMGVSRKHCRISIDEMGQIFIWDNHSTYGTIVENVRIQPDTWIRLKLGQRIAFGNEAFRIVRV